jgi:polysaccharide pyruvyl transferase WcaK-like protein
LDWIQKLNTYDLLITSRIHGSIAGLLSGIRVLCIIHDSRTKELCEELKVPHIYLDDLKNNSIQELYDKADQQKFIQNISIQKTKYELFLKECGIIKNNFYNKIDNI